MLQCLLLGKFKPCLRFHDFVFFHYFKMPKRKHSEVEGTSSLDDIMKGTQNKNSLDSDEEDDEDETDKYALKDDDIEGQEEGVVGLEEGVQFTPFNMNEELEEGHFDANGMYHWKKEKLIRDNWLENIDWIKIKEQEDESKIKDGESDDDMPEAVDTLKLYEEILAFLKPKETITKALKRLGGNKSLSASERLKLKKAGKTLDDLKGNAEEVIKLTELSNKILTATGNMNIYQETYEFIKDKVDASSSKQKAPDLDMYADDFEEKEKERLSEAVPPPSNGNSSSQNISESVVTWEYKETPDSTEVKGPYSTEQMAKWSESGHFKSGVLVRKCGTEPFYTSNRIDFELYL